MSSTFSTQTSNFRSGFNSSVDNRTGLYHISLPILSLAANNNLGPSVGLSLTYNSLDPTNVGYGNGFSLGLSSYNVKTGALNLSSGEKYRITETVKDVTVLQKKLNNFIFKKTKEAYRIIWKNGVIEELHSKEVDSDIKFPVRIISPLGHEVNFEWGYTAEIPRLKRLKDNFRTLLDVQYDGSISTLIDIFPGNEESKRLNLAFKNNNLSTLSLSTKDELSLKWSLDYQKVGSWYLINGITYPTGLKETATYQDNIMRFPNKAKLAALPAVVSFKQHPGGGQPATETTYDYSDNNYLGYGGNNDWDPENDFNYGIAGKYDYFSTETVVDSKKTITTKRKYNKFHLLKEEKTERDGVSMTQTLTYYADETKPFAKQVPQFLLPKEVKEQVEKEEGNTRVRRTMTEYDESGNLLKQTDPDGTVTRFSWYAPEGEKGCPAEPNGFTRFLKQKTTQYAQQEYDDVSDSIERYTYTTLGDTEAIVQDTLSIFNDSQLLRKKITAYHDGEEDPEFGRVTEMTETVYDREDSSTKFISSLAFTTEVDETYLKQTIQFTGHDGLTSSTERTSSLLTGLLLEETDAQGVKTVNEWDGIGRLLRRTQASNTRYEKTTAWSYSIKGNPTTVQTEETGQKITTEFDGTGRIITQSLLDIDRSKNNYTVYSAQYNKLGEPVSETFQDWLTDSKDAQEEYSRENKIRYGAWGEITTQTTLDGLTRQQTFDPVELTLTLQMQADRYATAHKNKTGIVKNVFDETSLQLVRREQWDANDREIGSTEYRWDGKGQLREIMDELGNRTQYTYDILGRVLTQTLPDGTVVTRTYAPFLTGKQVTSIEVRGPKMKGNAPSWVLGTQEFDSLGRLTERRCGGRTTKYQYDGAAQVPSAVVLPSGRTVEYTYIPELDNAVSRIAVDDIVQTFSYDKTTGLMLQGTENDIDERNVWSQGSHLMQEILTRGEDEHQTEYMHLLSGEIASYTDITGAETRYERDEYGRVIVIEDAALTTRIDYDELGRVSVQIVTDKSDPDTTMTTTLHYDDFNREVTRTIENNDGQSVTIVQTWLENNLLNSRKTEQNGKMIKEEHYDYDVRNRLILYSVTGKVLPADGYGHAFLAQEYDYDALNNLIRVMTTLEDDTEDEALYHYDNEADPTQLTSVTHTHPDYPSEIGLDYDKEGRMIVDEEGRKLSYDALGRLKEVKGKADKGRYDYNAFNHLIRQTTEKLDRREFFYRGDELVNEALSETQREIRFIKAQHTCLGVDEGNGVILTGVDGNDSLMWSDDGSGKKGKVHSWAPYGAGEGSEGLLGFNGERVDPVSGVYHLGNGYRAYNPILMRFTCPDSLSPFDAGGINSYAYCAGDPINFTDPSGHMSWEGVLGIVLGVGGLLLAGITAGASIAAAGGIAAALSSTSISSLVVGAIGVVSDLASIASGIVEESQPEASAILGWVSLATGFAGSAVSGAFSVRNLPKAIKKIKTNFIARENDRFYRNINDVDFIGEYRDYRRMGYGPREAAGEVFYNMGRNEIRDEMINGGRALREEQLALRRRDLIEPRRFMRQDSFSSGSSSSGFFEYSSSSSRSASFSESLSSLSNSPRSSVSSGSRHAAHSLSISGSESSFLRRMSNVSLISTESDYNLFRSMFIESANPGNIFSH